MEEEDIKNFRKMAGSLNDGTYGFIELEKAVNEILWDLGSYLDDYLVNSKKITVKLTETISEMESKDKESK